jgi:hypothetical protein
LRNYNSQQIEKLSVTEKEAIQSVLDKHVELLTFFGYTTSWEEAASLG